MAELIRNQIIIANTADKWEAIRKAPKINEAVVGENNTSQTLNIVWYGTSAEYQALPLKHPDTFYVITDSELPTEVQNYLLFSNKPKINGIELVDDVSLEDLSLYNRDAVDALVRQVGKILVVSQETWEQIVEDPTLGLSNSIYYVEKETEGAYDTYMMDANRDITYIGSNEAYFTEYQKCHPISREGGKVKDAIEIADGTVIEAIKTLGDEKELETIAKTSIVEALNEINAKKLGQEHLSHTLTHFGVWKSGAANRNYKLATVTFNSQYEYFTATLKLMPNYKNFHVTGAEIDFNLRAGAKSLDALQLYELKAYDVPEELPTGKIYIYIYYDKPSSYPQTAEIWLLTKSADYQEFMGDWQVKETMPYYPIAEVEVIEKPVDDPSFVHLTGGNFSMDLGQQRNNVMVIEGEMNTTKTDATRASIRTASGSRTDYVESLVSFTQAESPDTKAASVFNVHVMNMGTKTTLFATNIETNYEYRSTYDGSKWSDWSYIYGVDGGIGALQDITTAPNVKVGTNSGTSITVKNLKFTYSCIDMGEYYINEIRMSFVDNYVYFNNKFFDSKYRVIDGKLMTFSAIKGKPIIDNGCYATSFLQIEYPSLGTRYTDEIRDGATFINKDKTIIVGPRFFHSLDFSKSNAFTPGKLYTSDPDYPSYVEYNFLTRK